MTLPFVYTLTRRRGMKSVRLRITAGGKVCVSAPFLISQKRIELFLQTKQDWIGEKIVAVKHSAAHSPQYGSYTTHAKRAKKLIKDRVDALNQYYQFEYHRIAIKQHETRWGSCSRKKNLNFNYRLFFLPLPLVDYVVAHELSHLKEMNHSAHFWQLVSETIPDYKERKKMLQQYEM